MRVGVAGLLLLAAAAAACGPGTGGGSHASRRKRTPLVIHQSEPNTFEQHDSAAGKAEGRVRRGDPRFRDLVPNYNRNIVFRDEEGTGVDRLMTQRCKEKLNTLAIAVMNQWPNVQLRVEEGYEDNDDVHQGSLHYEGRAVDVTTSDRDRAKYGMLARLAVEAGFDWVHYESKKHIHCSVKSESSQAGPTGGCFPASSVVRLEGGRTATVSALRIGDRVLSGATAYSEVIAFLDRDENATRSFVRLHLSNGGELTATRAHLLLTATGAPVFAGSVRVGDSLLAPEGAARVVRLQAVWARGVFAPLTRAGTVVVDSALVSCYAGVSSARLAHYALAPLRAWLALLPAGAVQRGVHPYARALQAVGRALLPTSMFYD